MESRVNYNFPSQQQKEFSIFPLVTASSWMPVPVWTLLSLSCWSTDEHHTSKWDTQTASLGIESKLVKDEVQTLWSMQKCRPSSAVKIILKPSYVFRPFKNKISNRQVLQGESRTDVRFFKFFNLVFLLLWPKKNLVYDKVT